MKVVRKAEFEAASNNENSVTACFKYEQSVRSRNRPKESQVAARTVYFIQHQ
jgi:hypothetical protein